jgi:hypothetical protein
MIHEWLRRRRERKARICLNSRIAEGAISHVRLVEEMRRDDPLYQCGDPAMRLFLERGMSDGFAEWVSAQGGRS